MNHYCHETTILFYFISKTDLFFIENIFYSNQIGVLKIWTQQYSHFIG